MTVAGEKHAGVATTGAAFIQPAEHYRWAGNVLSTSLMTGKAMVARHMAAYLGGLSHTEPWGLRHSKVDGYFSS